MVDTAPEQAGADEQPPQPAEPEIRTERDRDRESNAGLLTWVRALIPGGKSSSARNNDDGLREAIEELIEEEETTQSAVAAHERRLISNILQLRDMPVQDVMVPRADIVAVDIGTSREELYQLLSEKPHSRIPVFKGDMDNIVGVIHMKDLVANIANKSPFETKDIMREPLVVSPAMRVMDLLLQMRQSKVHIAFVVDEFGGIDGVITINDLIEAIVGEIDDEYNFEITPQLIERPDGSAIVDARFSIRDFEEIYGDIFSEDDEHEEVDTLGGLVTYIAGHVPSRGEIIRHDCGIEFEVIDADPRRIMRLRLRNLPQKIASSAKE